MFFFFYRFYLWVHYIHLLFTLTIPCTSQALRCTDNYTIVFHLLQLFRKSTDGNTTKSGANVVVFVMVSSLNYDIDILIVVTCVTCKHLIVNIVSVGLPRVCLGLLLTYVDPSNRSAQKVSRMCTSHR